MDKIGIFKGKDISKMTREELLDFAEWAGKQMQETKKGHYLAALSELEEDVRVLAEKLVDRDTNLGMNESYRLALDEVLSAITTLKKKV